MLHLDYTLQVRDTEEKTATFYYIFKKEGKPMLQKGQDGECAPLDQDLYDRLDALKNSSAENDLLDAGDGIPGAFINDTQMLVVVSRSGGESEVLGFRRENAGGQWALCQDPESFSGSAPPAGSYIYPVKNG
jgi:hypothetical protein